MEPKNFKMVYETNPAVYLNGQLLGHFEEAIVEVTREPNEFEPWGRGGVIENEYSHSIKLVGFTEKHRKLDYDYAVRVDEDEVTWFDNYEEANAVYKYLKNRESSEDTYIELISRTKPIEGVMKDFTITHAKSHGEYCYCDEC